MSNLSMPDFNPVIIINLGASDLDVDHNDYRLEKDWLREKWIADGKSPDRIPSFSRELGQHVLTNYAKYERGIKLTIIQEILDHSLQYHRSDSKAVIYLIGTRQENTSDYNRSNDTFAVAQVVAQWLINNSGRYNIGIVRGCCSPLAVDEQQFLLSDEHDPSNLLSQYDHWNRVLGELRDRHPRGKRLLVGATAGIPSVNTALIVRSVEHFLEDCTIVYVPRGQKAVTVPISQTIWRERISREFTDALREHSYVAARKLVEQYEFCFMRPDDQAHLVGVQAALDLLIARTNFDFKKARAALVHLNFESSDPIVKELSRQSTELQILDNASLNEQYGKALLRELYCNALVQWSIGHYADFLTRYIAFLDNILAYIVADITRVNGLWRCLTRDGVLDWAKSKSDSVPSNAILRELAAGKRTDAFLHENCFDKVLCSRNFPYERGVTDDQRLVRYYICTGLRVNDTQYWTRRPATQPNQQNCDLNVIRNICFVNHGTSGVGLDTIKGKYTTAYFGAVQGEEPILSDMRQVLRLLGVQIDTVTYPNPYESLTNILTDHSVPIAP